MALQSLDIIRRSATTTPSPSQRQTQEVAKLIDVSKCIGCKACQVACMEWNDTRDAIGAQPWRARQPDGPDRELLDGDALCRGGNRPWPGMADPQGRLHALRRPGLPQGLPGAGRHRAVQQRHRRFPRGKLHRLRLLHHRLPVQHPAPVARRTARSTSAPSAPTGWRWGWSRPASRPVPPARSSSAPRRT